MKKTIAYLLCLTLVLGMMLCGCGGQDTIIGTWTGEADLNETLNTSMEQAGLGDYFNFTAFVLEMTVVFNEDGTYSMSVSEDSFTAACQAVAAELSSGMELYLTDLLEEQGLDMTVEEFLELSGISLEDLTSELLTEETLNEGLSTLNISGQYIAEEGKLYTSGDIEEAVDMSYCDTYTLDGSTLTITMTATGEETSLPTMILTRVK